jgi:hypothetical protein
MRKRRLPVLSQEGVIWLENGTEDMNVWYDKHSAR